MKTNYYAIYDIKAAAFLPAQAADTDGLAIRAFVHSALNPASHFATHPADFTLYKVFVFDNIKGTARDTEPSTPLGNAEHLLAQFHAGDAGRGESIQTTINNSKLTSLRANEGPI